MYGYMVWNNQFKCLGPMKWYGEKQSNSINKYTIILESGYMYPSDIENPTYTDTKQVFTEEGKVFKHRTLWLSEDDPEKAKKIFEQDFIDNCNEKIEEAQKQLERRIGILYC